MNIVKKIPLHNLNEIYWAIVFDNSVLVHRTHQPVLYSVSHAPRYFTLIQCQLSNVQHMKHIAGNTS